MCDKLGLSEPVILARDKQSDRDIFDSSSKLGSSLPLYDLGAAKAVHNISDESETSTSHSIRMLGQNWLFTNAP